MATLYKTNYCKKEILQRVGNISQLMGAQRMTISEGSGKGTDIIKLRNGQGLEITLLPDKALDIFDASYKSVPLAWISKKGLVNNGQFDDKGFGWLRSFGGGMLTTCGMRNAGPPVDDAGEHHGLHGRVSGVAATNVGVKEYWQDDEFIVEVSGKIREANVFGENMVINRTISISSANNQIKLKDEIVNEGFRPEPVLMLYHLNWGFPLFSKDSKLIINSESTVVRGDDQSEVNNWNTFPDPQHGIEEVVFFHHLKEDAQKKIGYQLQNPNLGIGVKVNWDKSALPYLIEWKMPGEGEYVLGLEPSNNLAAGRNGERDAGRLEILESFESKQVEIVIEVEDLV